MRYTIATLALAAAAFASPAPQGVTSAIAPSATESACASTYSGSFEIETVNITASSKRDLSKRQSSVLTLTLSGGILKDSQGRTGYIAENEQFQFDNPPQTGAIYTAGWSVCSNGTLAIGDYVVFQQCLSGDFYNLYLKNTADQCTPIYIQALPVSGSSTAGASQVSDGQVQATSAAVSQISDGQIQATTAATKVTQISDGQPQAPTAVVTQISDGQPQAPTAVVTQISDGQIQAPTAKATTASTSSKAVVSQISDGQIQAPTASATASTTRSAVAYTGAAAMPTAGAEIFGLAAGVLAVALL